MKFKYPKGATPIDDNELRDLIPDADLYKEGNARKNYISALKEADNFNYTPLMHFASS